MIGIANNKALISNLLSNSTVYLDTSHWPVNTSGSIKAELASIYATMSGPWLRYVLALGIIGAVIACMPLVDAFRKEERGRSSADTR
jgi:hypothetical protein